MLAPFLQSPAPCKLKYALLRDCIRVAVWLSADILLRVTPNYDISALIASSVPAIIQVGALSKLAYNLTY